jgi:hypothetical protein
VRLPTRHHHCHDRRLPPASAFAGFRFPAEVIVVAVRWRLRYNLGLSAARRRRGSTVLPLGARDTAGDAHRGGCRRRAGLPGRAGRAHPVGVASRRAACEQSDRGRSQPTQTPTTTDARAPDRPNRTGDHRRARLHAEPPTRTLRTGTRRPTRPTSRRSVPRTGRNDLTSGSTTGPTRHRTRQRNGSCTTTTSGGSGTRTSWWTQDRRTRRSSGCRSRGTSRSRRRDRICPWR